MPGTLGGPGHPRGEGHAGREEHPHSTGSRSAFAVRHLGRTRVSSNPAGTPRWQTRPDGEASHRS